MRPSRFPADFRATRQSYEKTRVTGRQGRAAIERRVTKSPELQFGYSHRTRMDIGWNRVLRAKNAKIKRLFFSKTKRGSH
jgi:hypothetical protein